jgi:tRNA pseudouridine55 synthase
MDGVVVIDKPDGLTSHDVVAAVRRLLPKGTKVGHTGTLDPLATGVLPVLLGKATRLARFLSSDDKRYRAVVAFGRSTTTYDRTGGVVQMAPPASVSALTREAIASALSSFVGSIQQIPPVFSAKKEDGVRAYERARRGETTPPPAVAVVTHALHLVDWDVEGQLATIDVHSGAGFYVRSLAHDIGNLLGVPAHLHALRRTAAGPFGEAEAVPLATLLGDHTALTTHARDISSLLPDMPTVEVTIEEARAIAHGRPVGVASQRITEPRAILPEDHRVRLLDANGCLLALATRQPASGSGDVYLHPDIVLL